MERTIVVSSIVSSIVTLAAMVAFQAVQAQAAPAAQTQDVIRVRAIQVVDLQDKQVAFIGSDVMNGTAGIWIGGPRSESQQIELLIYGSPDPVSPAKAGIAIRDDIRSVRNDPAVRGGHAGGPLLWQAP